MPEKTLLYIGTYTRNEPRRKGSNADGIYCYTFDTASGSLRHAGTTTGVDNPAFLAIDPAWQHLYAVSEMNDPSNSEIVAFAIDPQTGSLQMLNRVTVPGRSNCYISVDVADRSVLAAAYGDGLVMSLPIVDGRIAEPVSVVQHTGSGSNPDRQSGPHAHCIVPDPSGQFAVVADLGIDQLLTYRLDEAGQLLPEPVATLSLPPGAGPRHLVFHPDKALAYLCNELDSTITALTFDPASGAFEHINTLSTLPADFAGPNLVADIHIDAAGRFAYVSNRGHDSIAVFRIEEDGALILAGMESSQGQTPRNFCLDLTGDYLLAANQDSDSVVVFRVDSASGLLEATGHRVSVPSPVCLKMIAL